MINKKLSVLSLESGSSASIHSLLVSVHEIVNNCPRFAGELSQYDRSLSDCHYDDSWGPLNGLVVKHQHGNEVFYAENNTGWNFSELYLEMLALLKRNRLYFMKVEKKKVSGRFWLSLLPSWARQWIIDQPRQGQLCLSHCIMHFTRQGSYPLRVAPLIFFKF